MISVRKSAGENTDFKAMIAEGVAIMDVRTPEEFASGHIPGSFNIPLDQVGNRLSQIKTFGSPVIAVCRSGARSAVATGILKGAGIEVHNGGGWEAFNALIQ